MTAIDSGAAVKSAYEYLVKISPNASRFGNLRLEEIQTDEAGDYLLTLSYEVAGDFGFDKQKELKDFKFPPANDRVIRKLVKDFDQKPPGADD